MEDMLRQVYVMVFYSLKKQLVSLHQRLNCMLVILKQTANSQAQGKTSVCLQPFSENTHFYVHFFGILIKAESIAKAKYKDLYQVVV